MKTPNNVTFIFSQHRSKTPKSKINKVKLKVDSFIHLVENVEKLVLEHFDVPPHLEHKAKPYFSWLAQIGTTRGIKMMIDTNKESRNYVTRYLCGDPLMNPSKVVQLTPDFLPRKLGFELLKTAREGTHLEKRWLLTLLYSTRALELPLSPNIESITAPNRSEKLAIILQEMKSHSHGFWRAIGLRRKCDKGKLHFKQFHLTTNMGPNGHGLWSWWTDLKAIPKTLLEQLKTFAGPEFTERVSHLLNPSYSQIWDKMW